MAKGKLVFELVTITPAIAEKMLVRHDKIVAAKGLERLNRTVRDTLVGKYATDMKNNRWIVNGETIAVSRNGRVINGQHRLYACWLHGVTFKTFMVTGFDDEHEADDAFDTTDSGSVRTSADHLNVAHIPYGAIVAPMAKMVMNYEDVDLNHKEKGISNLAKMHLYTKIAVTQYAKSHSDRMAESAIFIAKNKSGIVSNTVLGTWHYIFAQKNKELADQFVIDLKDGIGLHKGDPVHTLRERLIQNSREKRSKTDTRVLFVWGVQCWNDKRAGRTRSILKLPENLECPRVR